jgi:hypothetical protein
MRDQEPQKQIEVSAKCLERYQTEQEELLCLLQSLKRQEAKAKSEKTKRKREKKSVPIDLSCASSPSLRISLSWTSYAFSLSFLVVSLLLLSARDRAGSFAIQRSEAVMGVVSLPSSSKQPNISPSNALPIWRTRSLQSLLV